MPASRRYLPVCVPMLISCLTGIPAMAADPTLGAGGPPMTYRLDQVTVVLTRHPGPASRIRRVSVSGTGSATLEPDGLNLPFRYPAKDLMSC